MTLLIYIFVLYREKILNSYYILYILVNYLKLIIMSSGDSKESTTTNTEVVSLIPSCQCRVSSVLQRNTKEYGKQFLFDGDISTCWNSDQGTPQWVMVRWQQPVTVTAVVAHFQVCHSHYLDT